MNAYKASLLASTMVATAIAVVPAYADDSGQIETVTVTVERVAEPLQKTPASVSVLTADLLQTAGVQNLSDVGGLIPNFTFNDGYRAGVPVISLRGIPTIEGGEAPVAFIVDGVQAPSLDFINQDLLDISSVQVLRGPQGGIYGRDAVGGAIVIETQKPTNDFQDTLTVDAGNGDYFRAVNTASGAIIPDRLWAKLTLEDHYFGGLIQNVYTQKPADSVKDYAGRLEIIAKPTNTTTIDLIYSRTQGIDGADPNELVPNPVVGQFKKYPVDYYLQDYDHRYIDSYSAKIDQQTPIGTLTSVSQYAVSRSTTTGSATWLPLPILQVWNPIGVKAFNEDVHLASPTDQAVQWVVGGFYQLRHDIDNLNVYYIPTPGGNPFCGCAGGPTDSVALDNDHNSSLAWAVYGQAAIDLPANFKLSTALRYDVDKRFDQDLSIPAAPTNAISHTFQAFEPSGTLSEQFTPDVMGYVTVGKGFRSGGFNAYTDAFNSGGLVPRKYAAETDLNYEAGVKSQFLDHHLTVNADVFHTEFNNEQYFLFNESPPARDVVTIKSATINGGELEVTYIPTEGLTLGVSGGVSDSNINSNDPAQNDLGKRTPEANLYTADLSALYRQPLWGDYDALYRVDYSYKGPICYDSANTYCYHPVGFLNARVGLESDRYTFALWAKNIFGVREPLEYLIGSPTSEQIPNEPATYGVELIAHF